MKTKTTIITALLLLAMVSGAVAQEKWEYAVILYNASALTLNISVTGEPFLEEKVDKKEVKGLGDRTPVLRKVNEMINKGWEVVEYGEYALAVYMRKKKQ